MKIKRLEIQGFKSFADKVVLDFQQGVTGVVGPNGCGKSNIVDAIRWCMGEQSAKNLRGKAMEDVIFAGSESRKPLGMAEVSLVFSTEDGRAPAKYLEFNEIQLTRRLYRDGESEYLINKTPCRLLDITELFMDTGVGTRAYSIIEQGKIGQVLHARPEERRLLIEEAAGVTKFKARKQLALKKIESTRQNLARLNDVIGEIRRQLNALQRQAKKAERFKELREEQREIDLLFSVHAAAELQRERDLVEEALKALTSRTQEIFGAASAASAQVEQCRLRLSEAEQQLAAVQEQSYQARSDAAAAENSLGYQRKEHDRLGERLGRLEAEGVLTLKRREELLIQQERLHTQRVQLKSALADAEEELQKAQDHQTELEQAFETTNQALEAQRRELFSAQGLASQSRSRIDLAAKRLAMLAERVERLAQEQQKLQERLTETANRQVALEAAAQQKAQEREQAEQKLAQLVKEEQAIAGKLPEIEQRWQTTRDKLSQIASRLKSQQELEEQLAGYGPGVQALLKQWPDRGRLLGLLADRLEVPEAYEAALEAVLGDRLQIVLCQQQQDLLEGLAYLRQNGAGRAQLALTVPSSDGATDEIEGATPLLAFVTADRSVQGLVSQLLDSVYLCSTLDEALERARSYPKGQFVTQAGELVSLGGVVAGGSIEPVAAGIIHKKREIKALEAELAILEVEVAALQTERDQLRQFQQELARSLLATRNDLHRRELEQAGLHKDLQQLEIEKGRLAERIKVQTLEQANLDEERTALETEKREAASGLEQAESRIRESEQAGAGLGAELEQRRTALADARERLTSLRVAVATLKEQSESQQRDLSMILAQLAELDARIQQGEAEKQECLAQREQMTSQMALTEQQVEILLAKQIELERQLKEAREAYEKAGCQLAEAEKLARSRREESETVRQRQAELTLRFSTLTLQLEHLEQALHDRHRCNLVEAQQRMAGRQFDEPSARARQQELEQQLAELGEVNLIAIEEYANTEQRHNFLLSQKNDLEASLNDLQQAIHKINRTTRRRFLETFNQVNEKFREVFPRLFCGGRAELRLTDEQDLLETGIDIIVQPPGKKLANVMLMSGGEKALTAVALIFSIFLIKPTPFCLLDEVDAPLDDANIGRFNEMVREMSAISQFIIITHNKATMGVADTLYGVTMEEPGASKIVSVRLQ